ncbi:MAG: pyruvate kinase, partial [Dehalococcoidia bacterium]|nr:pyruvate kinase [Dehalococcoidia bacterium]
GTLKPGKGVVFPGVPLSIPFLTDATRAALDFAAEQHADWVALSFVSGPEDIRQARDALRERGATIPLIAKIEMRQAVERLDAILREVDGVMVARGDLGLEMPVQKIPHVQKGIIRAANRLGKPVITATQMLESMILAPRPTRAEVTDVANAILDGTDAVMLSGETSVGQYPVQTVRMMEKIARETETSFPFQQVAEERRREVGDAIDDAIAHDACHTAGIVGARAIVAFTTSGSTALRVARYRPRTPLLALTSREDVRRRLALVWGVHPVVVAEQSSADEVFATASRCARELGLARPGDVLVITAGVPLGVSGSTNLLKVHTVAEEAG